MLQIYKASAGSGKTYNLAKQYLKMLLGRKDPETNRWSLRRNPQKQHRHILAITFTNKATNEMVRRIVDELAILAGRHPDHPGKRSDYMSDFVRELNASEEEIMQSAQSALFSLLFDFGFFHVSTIDSFFQLVLRTFAREIDLPDNFGLEINDSFIISAAVSEMLNSINYREPADSEERKSRRWLNRWLQQYMEELLKEGSSVNIFARSSSLYSNLVSAMGSMLNEDFKIHAAVITDYLEDKERIIKFRKTIIERGDTLDTELKALAESVTAIADYEHVNSYVQNFVEKCVKGALPKNMPKSVENVLDGTKNGFKKIRGREPNPDDVSLLRRVCWKGAEVMEYKNLAKVLTNSVMKLGLLSFVLKVIEQYCKDNNTILLSDTNSLLRTIINVDDTPFVYERLGYYLHHYLIDEFQDTSKMQWGNLAPLVKESLGYGRNNLIIGDEKQCIYRFRNSDPELLGSGVEREISSYSSPEMIDIRGMNVAENKNWRSAVEVVTFNNSLFRALAEVIDELNGLTGPITDGSARHTYAGVVQAIDSRRLDRHGYVKMIVQNKPVEKTVEKTEEKTDKFAFGLDQMVAEVNRMLDAGYRPKDICILVRRHTEGEAVISRLLSESTSPDWRHGDIQIVSSDAVKISSSPAVRIIISIMRMAAVPMAEKKTINTGGEERVTTNVAWRMAQLLNKYEAYLNSEQCPRDESRYSAALKHAVEAMHEDMKKRAESGEEPQAFKADLRNDRGDGISLLEAISLDTVVDRIIENFIEEEAQVSENIFLTAFRDLVYDFTQRGLADVNSFLKWWDNNGRHIGLATSADASAINVMTIHQSKGLEFPCVIIPFANWPLVSDMKNYYWYKVDKAQLADYVDEAVIPPFLPVESGSNLKDLELFRQQALEIAAKGRIDALNLAYVALTRAVNELIVVSPLPSRPSSDNLNVCVKQALALLENPEFYETDKDISPWLGRPVKSVDRAHSCGASEAQGDGTESGDLNSDEVPEVEIYTLGEPTSPDIKNKDKKADDTASEESEDAGDRKPSATADSVSVASTQKGAENHDFIAELSQRYYVPVNEDLLVLSQADLETFDFENHRHRGDFLHSILSRVRRPADLPVALRRAVYRAHLSPDQAEMCRSILEKALATPEVQPWFADDIRVLNEYTLTTAVTDSDTGDQTVVDRRPDRVVIYPDGSVDIIDYKFGEHNNKYFDQVRGYIRLMNKAGYSRVRGFLWYPLSDKILPVAPSRR